MLAKNYLPSKHNVLGWYASEKLDGVRAIFDGESFWTRNGNRLDAPYAFTAPLTRKLQHDLNGRFLDGELYMGRGRFNECSGIVRRHGDAWWGISFHAFDIIGERSNFAARNNLLGLIIQGAEIPHLVHVSQEPITDLDFLSGWHNGITTLGGEGLMLKNPASMYEQKRSSNLLKMKDFHDLEARCIGIENGEGKYKGMIGSLTCTLKNGVEGVFNVGSGLTDEDRARLPSYFIGKMITVKFFEQSKEGIPRFPIYKGVRWDA